MKASIKFWMIGALVGWVEAGPISDGQYPLSACKSKKLIKDIPKIGVGLWKCVNETATDAVTFGFRAGFRHLDSASSYKNEPYVGKGLDSKETPERSSIWVTSKVWNDMHRPKNVPIAFEKTLADLRVDYLDLYLMHWPVAWLPPPDLDGSDLNAAGGIVDNNTNIVETWKALEKLVAKDPDNPEKGTTRYIGISNFTPPQVKQILDVCTICPYAHEFEVHPYLQQSKWVDFHRARGIKVIAYSPLANTNPRYALIHPEIPPILEDPFWVDMARKKNVTAAQAVLGWSMMRDTIVIPKSTHEERFVENFGATKVKFTIEEMELVARQDKKARFSNPKSWGLDLFPGMDGG